MNIKTENSNDCQSKKHASIIFGLSKASMLWIKEEMSIYAIEMLLLES